MLIIRDEKEMLYRLETMFDRDQIDIARYRRDNNIPKNYTIEAVHTYPEDERRYSLNLTPAGFIVNQKINDGNYAAISDEELADAITAMLEADDTGYGFYDTFCSLCRKKNLSEIEVYKKAGLDRKLFSKIRRARNVNDRRPVYHTSKDTALALAVALGLNAFEAEDFLKSAGYAFEPGNMRDKIIYNALELSWGKVKIETIDEFLFDHGYRTLVGDA